MAFIREQDTTAAEAERKRLHDLATELELPLDVVAANQIHLARQSVREHRAIIDGLLADQQRALQVTGI